MPERTVLPAFTLRPHDFGKDFIWGVSTAAYQIEGAHSLDDKGPSIWDRFVLRKGVILNGDHGRIACDFYHRYKEDILLMKAMNIGHFRFSIAWSRILPDGTGKVSEAGIAFYNRVIDFCLECDVTPWITLYHWDLPQALEEKGGWTNRDILGWFETYVKLCAERFGDRVKHWMVLNEPMVFTGTGYFLGVHAPGRKGLKNFLPAVHHAVLCQALGGKILREIVSDACIGTTLSCSEITPYSNRPKDIKASKRVDALLNRLFLEPSLGLGYPIDSVPILHRIERYQKSGDLDKCVFDFDFIGVQNYTREVVKHNYFVPHIFAKIVKASYRNVTTTLMDWEVYPPSIYSMIAKFNTYSGINKIFITENGAAFEDRYQNGEVADLDRVHYLQGYLKQISKAQKDGLKVSGYFIWTLMDNFEWAEGYRPKFGLVHVDFATQKRMLKASGKWYRDFLDSPNS